MKAMSLFHFYVSKMKPIQHFSPDICILQIQQLIFFVFSDHLFSVLCKDQLLWICTLKEIERNNLHVNLTDLYSIYHRKRLSILFKNKNSLQADKWYFYFLFSLYITFFIHYIIKQLNTRLIDSSVLQTVQSF